MKASFLHAQQFCFDGNFFKSPSCFFFEAAINFVLRKSLKISVRERQMFD